MKSAATSDAPPTSPPSTSAQENNSRALFAFTLPPYKKALKDISTWKKLKNQSLSEIEIQQLKTIFDEL